MFEKVLILHFYNIKGEKTEKIEADCQSVAQNEENGRSDRASLFEAKDHKGNILKQLIWDKK